MAWSYRIISHPPYGMPGAEGERTYQIHEVFLEKGKIGGYSMNAFIHSGDSRNGLKQRLEYMQVAFVNPVVKLEDLDGTVSVFGDPGDK